MGSVIANPRIAVASLLALVVACTRGAPSSTTREDIVQFTVSVEACVPGWFLRAPALTQRGLEGTTRAVVDEDFSSALMAGYACVLAAGGDCVRVRACYGLESEATAGPCAGAVPGCGGDTLARCVPTSGVSPTQLAIVDCTVAGLSCLEATPGGVRTADCATAFCDVAHPSRCEGSTQVICNGAFETALPAPLGMTCSDASGLAQFVGDGEPCGGNRCDDGVLTECDLASSRTLPPFDCAAIGESCGAIAGCFRENATCSSSTFPVCASASVIEYCGADGLLAEFDCVAHGFSACDPSFEIGAVFVSAGCAPRGPRF